MGRCTKRIRTCQRTRGCGTVKTLPTVKDNVHPNVGGYVKHGLDRRQQLRLVNRRRPTAAHRRCPVTAHPVHRYVTATLPGRNDVFISPVSHDAVRGLHQNRRAVARLLRIRPVQNNCRIVMFKRPRRPHSRRETTRRGDRGVTTPRLLHLVLMTRKSRFSG